MSFCFTVICEVIRIIYLATADIIEDAVIGGNIRGIPKDWRHCTGSRRNIVPQGQYDYNERSVT